MNNIKVDFSKKDEFFDLYKITSLHLKSKFSDIKISGLSNTNTCSVLCCTENKHLENILSFVFSGETAIQLDIPKQTVILLKIEKA